MRIFVTGATGFIGARVVDHLVAGGHSVLGLTRSDAGARRLEAAGADALRGDIYDVASVVAGAREADAVVHLAFDHDFSRYMQNCQTDRVLVDAIGEAMAGSGRPFVLTSVTGIATPEPGKPGKESDPAKSSEMFPRALTEESAHALAARGVNTAMVRLPQVHDPVKQGLITLLVNVARQKRVSAYVAEGNTRWPAAHVDDVALLYKLAVERHAPGQSGKPGAIYHAVAEQGVSMQTIAEALGKGLDVPVRSIPQEAAMEHFGWLGMFMGHDMSASSDWTRKELGWEPKGPTLMADLAAIDYAVQTAI